MSSTGVDRSRQRELDTDSDSERIDREIKITTATMLLY